MIFYDFHVGKIYNRPMDPMGMEVWGFNKLNGEEIVWIENWVPLVRVNPTSLAPTVGYACIW